MNTKEEARSNVHWLYRYIFREVGWVAVAGVLTWLYLFFRAECTDEATGASFLVALAVSISGCGETKSSDPTEPEHELQKSARERDEAEGEGGPGQVNR